MSEDRYPFQRIESKWQKIWREKGINKVDLDNPDKETKYILVMFSYPSSSKLHIGHWWNFGPTDSYARFKRMQGYAVFEPMGFDSFGLPAENYAIKVGTHPREVTESSIATIMEQLEAIGAMYDWDYSVVTSRPEYYKWTQWLFLQLYKHGMAVQKEGLVNWSPTLQTVLANEQVIDGVDDREGKPVIKRKMTQWYFRITEYADKLLEGLKELDWPASTIKRQEHWIGKSEGATIRFPLDSDPDRQIEVFTTRPDTLFGVTYIVLAPEHDLLPGLATAERKQPVEDYLAQAARITEVERMSTTREKTGEFTGAYARHPFTGEKIPIWVADYVLGSYGTGAVMAVPAHDQRDFEFAEKYSLPIQVVIHPSTDLIEAEEMREAYEGTGIMANSNEFNGLRSEMGKKAITEKLEKLGYGGPSVTYRLRDWSISRQRYWGAPIPMIHCPGCGVVPVPEERLPVRLPDEIHDFRPKGVSPLGALDDWVNVDCPQCGGPAKRDTDTMDTFVCSSFYHLRYLAADHDDRPFDMERMKRWLPIDTYVGGVEHTTGHLIYFRFITRFLHDIGLCPVAEPARRLIHQGLIKKNGTKMSKSTGNVVNPDKFVDRYGSDVFRMYLMFMGDYREGGDWSDEGITGIDRFINRIWRLVERFADGSPDFGPPVREDYPEELFRRLHTTIKSVGKDLEAFTFNTAISRMMELVNSFYGWVGENGEVELPAARRLLRVFIRVLAPFAPHLAEEAWERLGGGGTIFDQPWPDYDERALTLKTITLVIQINGKVRDRIEIPADSDPETQKALALESEKIASYLERATLRKTIVVPGKLVNLVVG